jgi:hypothetical protein
MKFSILFSLEKTPDTPISKSKSHYSVQLKAELVCRIYTPAILSTLTICIIQYAVPGCINLRCQIAWRNKFCMAAPVCVSLVWNLLQVNLLAPRILRWFPVFLENLWTPDILFLSTTHKLQHLYHKGSLQPLEYSVVISVVLRTTV